MALGVIFGLSCSLMLKHSELGAPSLLGYEPGDELTGRHLAGRYTEIESCLVFLIAYTSYFFSNALTMSGTLSSQTPGVPATKACTGL